MNKDQNVPVERCPKCGQILPYPGVDRWFDGLTSNTKLIIIIVFLFLIVRGAVEMIHDVVKVFAR